MFNLSVYPGGCPTRCQASMSWVELVANFPAFPAAFAPRNLSRCVSWNMIAFGRWFKKIAWVFPWTNQEENWHTMHLSWYRLRFAGNLFSFWLFGRVSDLHTMKSRPRFEPDMEGPWSLSRQPCTYVSTQIVWLLFGFVPQWLDALLHSWLAGVTVPGHCIVWHVIWACSCHSCGLAMIFVGRTLTHLWLCLDTVWCSWHVVFFIPGCGWVWTWAVCKDVKRLFPEQGHWAFLGKPTATKLCLGRGSMTWSVMCTCEIMSMMMKQGCGFLLAFVCQAVGSHTCWNHKTKLGY